MEFCQPLTSQGINLTAGTGSSFSLDMDTKESGKPASFVAEQAKKNKMLSSSDVNKNKKAPLIPENIAIIANAVQCQCGNVLLCSENVPKMAPRMAKLAKNG